MQKRHKTLAICIAILSIIQICIERPLYLLTYTMNEAPLTWQDIHGKSKDVSTASIAIHIIHSIFALFVISSTQWFLLLRYWLIHYNVQWTKATIASKWIIHLNRDYVKTNWYLQNKSKYGSLRYTLKRLTIFLIGWITITLSLTFLLQEKLSTFVSFISSIGNLIPVFSIFILYINMRKFDDNFYVMKEIKYVAINFMIGVGVYMIVGTVTPYLGATTYLRVLLVVIISVIIGTMSVLIQIWWVVYVIENDKLIKLRHKRRKKHIIRENSTTKDDYGALQELWRMKKHSKHSLCI